jgi:sulfite exporter TauE/SafE/copper chaperone CopZ
MRHLRFHITGTHCKSCKILTEGILSEQHGVSKVHVDIGRHTIEVHGDFDASSEQLLTRWNHLLASHNYELSLEKKAHHRDWKTFSMALPLALLLFSAFILLQKSGWLNIGFEGELTPWTALLIGIVASLSTCLAVVGGLVLSLSAKVSQDVKTTRPFVFFHLGRLLGFAGLGAVLGALGSVIGLNATVSGILGLLVALLMILIGVQLLDLFPLAKTFQLTLPKNFHKKIVSIEGGKWAPFLIGVLTFFLPCGFTQSMQWAALSSGSWIQGMMIMSVFALGTFPVLALISFTSFSLAHRPSAKLFMSTAGILVIGFGIIALLAGLAGLGIIAPLFIL